MTERILGEEGSRRRWRFRFLVLPILLCTGVALLLASSANAVHDLQFQLDGDVSLTCFPAGAPGAGTPPAPACQSQVVDWGGNADNTSSTDTGDGLFVVTHPTATTELVAPNADLVPDPFAAASFTRDFESGAACTLNSTSTTFCTSDDTTYATGSKDTLGIGNGGWQCNHDANVNSKIDIMNSYVASTTNADGDLILYFGLEKNKSNGTNDVGVWFLRGDATCTAPSGHHNFVGSHQDGDVLVVSEFTAGGGVSTIKAFRWAAAATGPLSGDGGCIDSHGNPNKATGGCDLKPFGTGQDCKGSPTGSTDIICATTNASGSPAFNGTVKTPWLTADATLGVGNNVPSPDFFEGGINITKAFAGAGGATAPSCFTVGIPDTRSSASATATLFDFVINKLGSCSSTLSTQQNSGGPLSIGTGTVSSGTDTATLDIKGTTTWGGTLAWYLCGPSATTCSTSGTQITSRTVSNNSVPSDFVSDAATLSSAGTYCWHAHFEPDGPTAAAGVTPADDDGTNECFTVNPVTPSIPTVASGPVALTGLVSDTANLSGTANKAGTPVINPTTAGGGAGGSITFRLYGPSATNTCTAANLVFTSSAIPVSGDGAYSSGTFQPTAVGTYRWIATYTGDSPNTNGVAGTCGASNESVIVSSSSLATTPKDGSGNDIPGTGASITTAGSISVKDSASLTVNGATTWTGTLTFFLCKVDSPGLCTSGGTQIGSGQTVTNATTFPVLSDAATVTSAGRYCWRGVFTSGTTGVPNSTDATSGECFTVNPVTPSIPTQASGTVVLGNAVSDTANLSGTANKPGTPVINPTTAGGPAGGSITFRLYGPSATNTCTAANLVFTSAAIPVSGDAAYGSGNFTPTVAGTYRWIASYTGDLPNTLDVAGTCGASNESVVVSPKQPTISTQVNNESPLSLGSAISDTATLGNTATPSNGVQGTITFTAYGPELDASTCGTIAYISTIDVTGDGAYNSANGSGGIFIPLLPGHYNWIASYTPAAGDVNNLPVTGHCGDAHEGSVLIQLQPTMNTAQNFVPNDSATITVASGAGNLAGSVVFKLYVNNASCSGAADYTSSSININSGQPNPGTPGMTKTVASGNTTAYGIDGTTFSWVVTYTNTNPGHQNVSSPCANETSSITIHNGTQQP
jgi:hypothetical protein